MKKVIVRFGNLEEAWYVTVDSDDTIEQKLAALDLALQAGEAFALDVLLADLFKAQPE
jgi:hypothetical protein